MSHIPVLVAEAIGYLRPERGGLFVDVTVGLGGHARAVLEAGDNVRLFGLDRDPFALAEAGRRLSDFGERVELAMGRFGELEEVAAKRGVEKAAGVLADLGVSSLQLDTPERGFSFRRSGPLDMRMGTDGPTAKEVVNSYSEAELKRLFSEYGEERQAGRIARVVAEARRTEAVETTEELSELIYRAKGGRRHDGRVDAATRVFQALRIEVNRELEELKSLLDQAVHLLDQDGRLVVISYHSLEDRIVKNSLRTLARGKIDEVTGRPWSETRLIEVLTRKPIRPGDEEVALNPRARSARLRAARRI
ncbi:MAG: 16S rRNA (cytosine(1402)-N(4))-methyltransferase RsmH [Acidobacteriota bacterium]|nr:16S rRNA (cytosine(1402)-N(4))-methyltransferase RsmH [Acidobacteriota bacterium]